MASCLVCRFVSAPLGGQNAAGEPRLRPKTAVCLSVQAFSQENACHPIRHSISQLAGNVYHQGKKGKKFVEFTIFWESLGILLAPSCPYVRNMVYFSCKYAKIRKEGVPMEKAGTAAFPSCGPSEITA